MSLTLTSDRMQVVLEPAFGARVTGLTDLVSKRQWLVAGDCRGSAGDDAVYSGDEARGWDECFPTVSACDHPAWGRMRDHGLLWGRPWQVTLDADGMGCSAQYAAAAFRFERGLRLNGGQLTAQYRVTNLSDDALPYLWSQHALLATGPQDRIGFDGIGAMTAGKTGFDWPLHPARDLSRIGAIGEGFALKSYGVTPRGARASIHGPDGGIAFDWSDGIPAFGLWLDYGAWPPEAPLHQIALEPTTAPADHLAAAEAIGMARKLPPGQSHSWSVRVTLIPAEVQGTDEEERRHPLPGG